MKIDIPYYLDYLPSHLLARLAETGQPVAAVEGLKVAAGLRERFPNIESDDALRMVSSCDQTATPTGHFVSARRIRDRVVTAIHLRSDSQQRRPLGNGQTTLSRKVPRLLGRLDFRVVDLVKDPACAKEL